MKTWILIWVVMYPQNDSGQYQWKYYDQANLTYNECVQLLAKKQKEIPLLKNYVGHKIYCKNSSHKNGLKTPEK